MSRVLVKNCERVENVNPSLGWVIGIERDATIYIPEQQKKKLCPCDRFACKSVAAAAAAATTKHYELYLPNKLCQWFTILSNGITRWHEDKLYSSA